MKNTDHPRKPSTNQAFLVEFEVLLERWHHNTAVVYPAAADINPELFEKYLQREQEICAPRIDAFE